MIKILSHVQQYVPNIDCSNKCFIPSRMEYVDKPESVLHKKLFGGDQLTAARARGAQLAMSNSKTAMKRFNGVIPVIKDWHTEVLLYEVSAYILIRIYLNDILYTLRSFGNIIMMLGLVENILHCINYAIVLIGPML